VVRLLDLLEQEQLTVKNLGHQREHSMLAFNCDEAFNSKTLSNIYWTIPMQLMGML
jgi:hypothetical protein